MTRDLDDLLAWLATRMDKSAVARLFLVSWRTVGRSCERVVATELDPDRLDGLFRIGVDEISWCKHHKYLTVVVDHDRSKAIWGAKGKDAKTLDAFFDELSPDRLPSSAQCRSISALLSQKRAGRRSCSPGHRLCRSVPPGQGAPRGAMCTRAGERPAHPGCRSSLVKLRQPIHTRKATPNRLSQNSAHQYMRARHMA